MREESSLERFRGLRGNILVIAPHPDDDVLGAGGTMAVSSAQGRGVFSVYITDGGGSLQQDQSIPDKDLVVRRQKEALSALDKIGAQGGFFLQYRSEELRGEARKEIRKELTDIFRFLTPEEIFLTAPYERHLTHQRCTALSLEALRQSAGFPTALLGYSLWGSFWGGKRRIFRDITPFIRKKVDAVLAHASQIATKNYQQGILGKNNYEAIFWESHEPQGAAFVEIFLDMTELLQEKDLTLEGFIRRDFEAFIRSFPFEP